MANDYYKLLSAKAKLRHNYENVMTQTSVEQCKVEKTMEKVFEHYRKLCKIQPNIPVLNRADHIKFIVDNLTYLSRSYQYLDSARPWLCYWSVQSLSLLNYDDPNKKELYSNVVKFLSKCQTSTGGFGGGPGQYAHLATTYAAVNALCIIGTEEAYKCINRKTLREFLWSLRSPEGAFCMHVDGEIDIRGVYCALNVASLTDVGCDNLFSGTAEWVRGCQSYEGGFSGYPGTEAHGGYTFCGLAALVLLGKLHLLDTSSFLRWIVNRQMKYEGGFQGRTNKLVDGCYSFWQSGAIALVHEALMREYPPKEFLFNQMELQNYILTCCQHPHGGLLDKPGKPSDLYHTCYTLSGLSIAQTNLDGSSVVLGDPENEIGKTHFVYNIQPNCVLKAKSYFKDRDIESESSPSALIQEV